MPSSNLRVPATGSAGIRVDSDIRQAGSPPRVRLVSSCFRTVEPGPCAPGPTLSSSNPTERHTSDDRNR